jgi:hypothetical protein
MGLLAAGCSFSSPGSPTQSPQALDTFSMTQAGELDSSFPKVVTVPLVAGRLRLIADVIAGAQRLDRAPAFRCTVRRLLPGGDGATSAPVAAHVSASPQFHHTVFTLTSDAPLQAGTYRLWMWGHGAVYKMKVSVEAPL